MEWLDDPRISRLMVHLGKKVDGKYTRSSFAAHKLDGCLLQAKKRLLDLKDVSSEVSRLTAQHEQMSSLLRNREHMLRELRHLVRETEQDALRKNPDADQGRLTQDSEKALADFNARCKDAADHIEEVRQAINSKKSAARRHEDRVEFYRKQAQQVLNEAEAA